MVTFTIVSVFILIVIVVSVGCRPNGHFHLMEERLTQILFLFQWAVARMVTFTPVPISSVNFFEFQWAVARMVTFTKYYHPWGEVIPFQWAVARMVTFTQMTAQDVLQQWFQWAVARMVTFTNLKTEYSKSLMVSVGCRPNGHFHTNCGPDTQFVICFSGLSPEWSLSL